MTNLIVNGGKKLSGRIQPSGNKNAILPMLCATLLSDEKITLSNVPNISDVDKILAFFAEIGSSIKADKQAKTIEIQHNGHYHSSQMTQLPTGIRSAVLLIAPTLFRFKSLIFDTDSKGCALGVREIDPHLEILELFGCHISSTSPYTFELNKSLTGQKIWLDYASVTTTEAFLMLAAISAGRSTIINAACEPHVQEFCHFLVAMGAKITGIGSSTLVIQGVEKLVGCHYKVPDVLHEVATFLMIGGATGGKILVETDITEHMTLIIRQLQKLGMNVTEQEHGILVDGSSKQIKQTYTTELMTKVEASPWPYFPADLLPQLIGSSISCKGEILFWNKVYEGALSWVGELSKFGAKVHLSDPHRLVVIGSDDLRPATVEAPYIIRVVLGLFIAALQIDGESVIKHADPIKRAHPDFVEKLKAIGADVEWVD
ncbi:MAG TPA: UDP-N-acetylglucosamine 1-carboxyvinyltransferase [Oceanospirillales bacterium]|nr:UDP-N-acetylglucosamine 1-carboxyvinyltransferase [Oceanospirillales bacterium]